ncbi:MAG: hypothetical protein ACRD0H_20820 [Actinomycetes bacterium]
MAIETERLWAQARNDELVHDLRRRGIHAAGVRIHVDGYLSP